jgi:hypothetical protein
VSQPLNQRANCEALGELDTEQGEFWMENPWDVGEHNLSAFERNRVLLNTGQRRFVDVSYLTTADLDSDSRAVVAGDFNGDGMEDVIVRSCGGGPLRVFENRWPRKHWLTVSLRGVESNSLGLGAKLRLEVDGRTLWRELYPINSFLSQMPSQVHFGLDQSQRVDRLTIDWPSGKQQTLENLDADRHLVITEGDDVPHILTQP